MASILKKRKILSWIAGIVGFSLFGSLIHFSEEIEITEILAGILYLAFLVLLFFLPGKSPHKTPRLLRVLPWIWILNAISALLLAGISLGDHWGKWVAPNEFQQIHPLEMIWAFFSGVALFTLYKRSHRFFLFFGVYATVDIVLGVWLTLAKDEHFTLLNSTKLGLQLFTLAFLLLAIPICLKQDKTRT